jgi:hypothetical protein
MKLTKTIFLVAAVVTTLALNQSVQANNLAAASAVASASVHRFIVASPHGLEEFPWLLREPSAQKGGRQKSEAAIAAIKKNRAFATSPRVREQFPELARAEWSSTDVSSKRATAFSPPAQVMKNRALANSPRMKEEFPALARGYAARQDETSIAPLK